MLRALRQDAPFDGRFFERDARFWPIARAARAFVDCAGWPDIADYARAFGERPQVVRFVPAVPRPRRRAHRPPGPVDLEKLYDAHICRGEVPTRPRHWHDFLNALVWATFPRAKRALHARQHAVVRAWVPDGAARLPGVRSHEHDALAVLDEGGVVVLRARGAERPVIFGHAIYEGFVLGGRSMVARALVADVEDAGSDEAAAEAADAAIAVAVSGPLPPGRLVRFSLEDA